LKGVKYRHISANRLLTQNIVIYGIGGLIIPFIGIKLIDMLLMFMHKI
jgi:K+-transporting ATPase ATPase B chain